MADDPVDDNTQDITSYDLAERIVQGRHVSDAGHKEIAAELHRVQVVLTAYRHHDLVRHMMDVNAIPPAWEGE